MRGSPFFEGVSQLDIEIGGQPGKTPTFYYDGRGMTAVFPARYRALRDLMPDPSYVPARLAPGLGVMAIACLEYLDTDVGPYNELLIGVPLNEPPFRANLPGRALAQATRRGKQPSFVWQLPVTTDVALRGGIDFYNFPKFIAAIDFSETTDAGRCRLAEGKEHILTLSGERIATPRRARVDHFLRLWMDGQPQAAHFRINQLAVGSTSRRTAAALELGERHPIARELDRLLVSRKPGHYESCPRFEAILFGPEHPTLPLMRRGLTAADALERRLATG
jgi:hypothetical protein